MRIASFAPTTLVRQRSGRWPSIALLAVVSCLAPARPVLGQTVRVDRTPAHATNSFRPSSALGAGVDRLPRGAVDKLFTPPVLQQILSAGWGPISYRQNTELHVEAWHWNPIGAWSDPLARQGYFTGSATPAEPIRHSFAYPLPHRGFTRNDGTERGYSRLTDGDPASYWKSNPYLTRAFTGEDDSLHPQWIVIDLGREQPVNAVHIVWAEPYARAYQIAYWTGEDPKQATRGEWRMFPGGAVTDGMGGSVTLKLGFEPQRARFIRVWMTASSNTCDTHGSGDRRNCVGYAIKEVYAGTLTVDGEFHDLVHHSADQNQTTTYCSSVDPWHQAADLNENSGDQTGFDLFYTSGITRGLPAMIPVAMLYATPEDAAAEIAYVEKRGYPISYVEMGEEPDGQCMLPEDYAALYLQWATAIHRVDPALKLGGPIFEGFNEDLKVWPDAHGHNSWFTRFLDYLTAHGRLSDLAFMSFEHYPFEPCDLTWENLYDEPKLVSHILQVWRDDGLPPQVPVFITEVNIAWQTGELFADVFGGLWEADYVGAFLTAGGKATYYFHYMPLPLSRGCHDSWGTFAMFTVDSDYQVTGYTSQFFASQLITQEWAQPGDGIHQVFPASSDVTDPAGHVLVTAYALLRPDGQWSLLLVNKDHSQAHPVRIVFHDSSVPDSNPQADSSFSGLVSVVTFGSAQYQWRANGKDGRAEPDGPALKSTLTGQADTLYTLPAASITVLRGQLSRHD